MSWSSIMSPMSQRQHVVSNVSLDIFRHRMRLMKILVISFSVSKSMSFVLKHEMMIVLRHS